MRLWSLHPRYLDSKGLVALWREGLLAQKVLLGETKGYRNHPQLARFKAANNPAGVIAHYLHCVVDEAENRAYKFDRSKLVTRRVKSQLPIADGQLEYEMRHLLDKLAKRNPDFYHRALIDRQSGKISSHPMFAKVPGPVAEWERT